MKEVIEIVSSVTGVDITEPTRKRHHTYGRAIYYKIMYDHFKWTYEKIAESVGKNHASVIHAVGNFEMYTNHEPELKSQYKKCLNYFAELDQIEPVDYLESIEKLTIENRLLKQRLVATSGMNPVMQDIAYILENHPQREVMKNRLEAFVKMNKC